jgi:hypothetical protein
MRCSGDQVRQGKSTRERWLGYYVESPETDVAGGKMCVTIG